jgi:hypothetical protein
MRLGTRSINSGANAAAVSRKKTPRPMARPIAGNHSHRPSHETARNRPMTVATDASTGHSRSQKMVQRARKFGVVENYWKATGSQTIDNGRLS